jgi:MFS family permease
MYWGLKYDSMFSGRLEIMGYIWAGITIFALAGVQIAKVLLHKNVDYSKIVYWGILIITPSILLAANTNLAFVSLVGYLIHEIGRGIFTPIQLAYVNKYSDGDKRATMMSFEAMISSGGSVVGLLVFGLIARSYGINLSWIIAGISFLVVAYFYFKADRSTKLA